MREKVRLKNLQIYDQFLMFECQIQIWPKSLSEKVTMQCTKMKTHTGACYPCITTKTKHFFSNFSDVNIPKFFFMIIGISMRLLYIPDAVFSASHLVNYRSVHIRFYLERYLSVIASMPQNIGCVQYSRTSL